MGRITDATLRNARPARRQQVADSESPLTIRLSPSGRHRFQLRRMVDGTMYSLTHPSHYPAVELSEAREWALAQARKLDAGQHPAQTGHPSTLTVNDLFDRWMRQHVEPKLAEGTATRYRGVWERHLLPEIGDIAVEEFTRSDAREAIYRMEPSVEANRTLDYLRACLNWAVDMELLDANPAVRIPRPFSERPPATVLTPEQVGKAWKVWQKEDSIPARAFSLALLTGCRIGSLLPARQSEIVERPDGPWLEIPAARMKASRRHAVPLSEVALELVADADGYLLPAPRLDGHLRWYSSAMRRYKDETGADVGPQVIRRTVATMLARELSVPGHVIQAILAHAPRGVTDQHYQVYRYDRERREALERWAEWVIQAI